MRILFFSPYAAIWVHEKPEIEFARELIQYGHEISFIRCNSHFDDFCISMSAFGLSFGSSGLQKFEVCTRCVSSSRYIDEMGNFPSEFIPDLKPYENEIKKELENIDRFNWWNYELGGLPIGRFAAYEFVLHNKLSTQEIPVEKFSEYLSSLRYSLGIYYFAEDYFQKNKFDAVIVYNRLYSLNNVFCAVGLKHGVESYTLHASGNLGNHYGKYSIFRSDYAALTLNKSDSWRNYSLRALSSSEVDGVLEHFHGLFEATSPWVYSTKVSSVTPQALRERLGIPLNSKVVLLATSSVDELFAIKMILIIWIK